MCASFSSFSFGGRCPAARHRLMHRRPANRTKAPSTEAMPETMSAFGVKPGCS
ncbi:hypothetical protein [Parabacteroides gordonii]|uniref:hypothetical protein n=1 Tax=Parabacteroides gordonii TaxID=574930 RepID=UPI001CE13FEA|nr:hypothetical protein [Parabacteroides gordonii]MCA5586179.1 hypothetical protein [Parabacteroides gordonii]